MEKCRITYRALGFSIMLFMGICCAARSALAQPGNAAYRTHPLYDSLMAVNNKDFLYNNVTLTNLSTEKITLLLTITPPPGWNMVTQKTIEITLNANENSTVPLRLLPSGSAGAAWQWVKINYRLNGGVAVTEDSFRVRVQEFTRFKATLPNSNQVMLTYQKSNTFPVLIKNTGNTATSFTVTASNIFFDVSESYTITVPPVQDTMLQIPVRISESKYALLRKEEVKVVVVAANGETANLLQYISKIGSVLREHSSAYLDMPLQLEAGGTYQGSDNIQYFGGVHGLLQFNDSQRLALDYRSKTFAKGQRIDNQIIRAEYNSNRWDLAAGTIMDVSDFYMDGYGGKVGYKWKNDGKAELYGMLISRTGDSKVLGGNVHIGIRDKAALVESFAINFDQHRKLNSYIVRQAAELPLADKGKVVVFGGVGMEQTSIALVGNAAQTIYGSSFGYNLQWANKFLSVTSSVLYNSNSYPGIFKGQRLQLHDVRAIYKNLFVGAFYEFNLRKQNYYYDTTFFSDVFNLQTDNYGVKVGYGYNGSNVILSAGRQSQVQAADTSAEQRYIYTYLNLNTTILLFKKLYFSTNAYIGTGALSELPGSEKFISSTQATLQYKSAGLLLRYDNGPYYYHEYITYLKNPQEYERLIASPYGEVSFFKRSLHIRSQFNFARTLPDQNVNSSILGNVIYSNFKRGFDFNFTAIIPVQQMESTPYFSASLRMRLHTPFVLAQKYYTLRVLLFKDADGDGQKGSSEEGVVGQTMAISGTLFISDEKGAVYYKNISKGEYTANFSYNNKVKGWIPSGGIIQTVQVRGNTTLLIPYKKSKVLQGKLQLSLDSLSNLSFSVGNIKVTATSSDSIAVVYSTITDENGEFYFNLPSGIYTVSLSELAFDENFKPTQYSQVADMTLNAEKTLYFEVKQKRRQLNIRKK